MPDKWFRLVSLSTLLLCPVSSRLRAADDGAALPRYRLEVGQELVYQLTSQEDPREAQDATKGNAPRDQMEWRIVVGRQNPDGSWRLHIRTKVTIVNRRDGAARRKWDSFGYCDLHADGAYSLDEKTAVFKRLMPYELFCRLPSTAAALEKDWKHEQPVDRSRMLFTYRLAERGRDHWRIIGVPHGDYGEGRWQTIYSYDFDTLRGLVAGIAWESKDLAANQVTDRRTIRLISSARRDPAWVARFQEEAQKFLEVQAKWMAFCYEGVWAHSLDACHTVRTRARALLLAGREQAKLDVIRELYDATIKSHDDDEKGHEYVVKQREEFFAAAPTFPATWEAKNLDGGMFRLAEQRGKVVVLFFWITGCEYNLLAGPQICQLVSDYQDKKDVAIVGMFVRSGARDEDATAKRFIAKCFQGFPHLEGKDITALYGFRQYGLVGYPAILIVDQAGRVQDMQCGYGGDMAERIRKIVDHLRSKSAQRKD